MTQIEQIFTGLSASLFEYFWGITMLMNNY